MSDLTQLNLNLNALNEKQEEANRIAKDNTASNNEGNTVLQSLGETITRGEEKASSFIGEKFKGLKEGIKGLMPSQEEKGEQRRGFADFLKGLGDKFKGLAGIIGKGFSKGKDAVGGFFAPLVTALKGIVIGGFLFLFLKKLPELLNSPLFLEITKTVKDVIIPAAIRLYEDFIKPFAAFIGEKLMALFQDINDESKSGADILKENAGILSAAIGLLALNMFGVSGIITGASFIMKGMMISAGLLKTAFIFIGGKLMLIGSSLMASIVPMAVAALPFIAIGAAVVGAIALVITAIQNIRERFTEGQTLLERIKIIAQEIFLAPVRLFQNIIGFIAEKLGFEKFAAAVKGFNPLEFFSNMFSNIGAFLKEKFSLNEKTKEDLLKAFKFVSDIVFFIPKKIASFLKGIIPDKLKKFLGFGGDEDGEDTITPPAADTSAQDTQGASVIEDQNVKKKKSFLQKSVFENLKSLFPKAKDFNLENETQKELRASLKAQKQELMDAAYGSANQDEFAKQVKAGTLAAGNSLGVDASQRSKFTTEEAKKLLDSGVNAMAMENQMLKSQVAGMGQNNVSTAVVDNSTQNNNNISKEIIDPQSRDFNFRSLAAHSF
tara:strand:+ start:8575 stop:10392 length:1818 start_codon:yes stop_codon:yes gene_type:complete